jgi:hypothetical protein
VTTDEAAAALDRGDVDELIGIVDRLCGARAWDDLTDLVDRCRRSHEQSGRQLWPVAAHGEYRLALEAPGEWAAPVLVEGAGRFALGPLPEVAASTHAWAELAPHLVPGPTAVLAAHERVVRGEDLGATTLPGPPVLDLPLRLQDWEPRYCVAEYRAHEADFPAPALPSLEPALLPNPAPRLDDRESVDALLGVVAPWAAGSGVADACVVDGDAADAIATLGHSSARVAPMSAGNALALLGWAGASGGAHGRRPGAAAGRFAAWWVVGALGGLLDDWPAAADVVGDATAALRWFAWDAGGPTGGWALQIAVEDPTAKRAWALDARDPGESAP